MKFDPFILADHFDCLIHDLLSTPEPLRSVKELLPSTATDLEIDVESIIMSTHMAPKPGDGVSKAIESTMRILAILFLRDPLIDLPCGEKAMFRQLEKHVKTILISRALQKQQSSLTDTLLFDAPMQSQKPVLIWISITGSLLSIRNAATPGDGLDKLGRPSVYMDLLRSALEPAEVADPELVSEEDLALCRVLELRSLSGEPRDERLAMRRILGLA
jgi:hypothetical protein